MVQFADVNVPEFAVTGLVVVDHAPAMSVLPVPATFKAAKSFPAKTTLVPSASRSVVNPGVQGTPVPDTVLTVSVNAPVQRFATIQLPVFGTTMTAFDVSAPVTAIAGVEYCPAVSVVVPPVVDRDVTPMDALPTNAVLAIFVLLSPKDGVADSADTIFCTAARSRGP
jgi:hypothetical protein